MSGRPRLLLVEDHPLVLEGLRLELQEEYDVVGTLATGGPVVEECRRLHPDLVVLDLGLPDQSGLEVIADLKSTLPNSKVLVVTMHGDPVLADAALQAGAEGFIPKDAEVAELFSAIRTVLEGNRYLSPLMTRRAAAYSTIDLAFGLARLTPRQREIVRLLGDGKSTARMAVELRLSPNTVTFHRVRIRKALGIPSEWGLLKYALVVRMSEERARPAGRSL